MQKMKIYIASSWKNSHLDTVVSALTTAGHEVFDFRRETNFGWSQVDKEYKTWTAQQFQEGLNHPVAMKGFDSDMAGLDAADAVVLVLPCNRSAHLELGYAVASGKATAVLLLETPVVAELMYGMVDAVVTDLDQLMHWLDSNRPVDLPLRPLPFRPAEPAFPTQGEVKLPGYNFGVTYDFGIKSAE